MTARNEVEAWAFFYAPEPLKSKLLAVLAEYDHLKEERDEARAAVGELSVEALHHLERVRELEGSGS